MEFQKVECLHERSPADPLVPGIQLTADAELFHLLFQDLAKERVMDADAHVRDLGIQRTGIPQKNRRVILAQMMDWRNLLEKLVLLAGKVIQSIQVSAEKLSQRTNL